MVARVIHNYNTIKKFIYCLFIIYPHSLPLIFKNFLIFIIIKIKEHFTMKTSTYIKVTFGKRILEYERETPLCMYTRFIRIHLIPARYWLLKIAAQDS